MATIYTRAGKGSALTWTEGDANITNLNNAKIENVVEDLTPQLGGDLDVNGKVIVSASNGNIRVEPNGSGNIALTPTTGKIILGALDFPTGMGSNGQVLTTNGSSAMTWSTPSTGLTDVVNDTTPQLGGNLDVNGKDITSASNGNINIAPNGSGNIALTPSTGKIILGALDFPTSMGSNGQVLTTNGSSAMTWTTVSGGASSLDGLSDVVITAAATNDVLVYDGSNWVDTAASGLTVGTATTATNANNINISTTNGNSSDTTLYPVLVGSLSTGNQLPHVDSTLSYNASTDTLTASNFAGAAVLTGLGVTGVVNLNPASATVSLQPTGIGTVTINPATVGTINKMSIGATTPSTGAFTTLSASSTVSGTGFSTYLASPPAIGGTTASTGRFTTVTSTVATGTAPFTVASTTNVANLNASSLNGATFDSPGSIGSTTASTGTFTTLTVNAANDLRLADSDSSNYVGFKAPATVSANKVWTLPSADGTANQVLKTDGAGALGWATVSGGFPMIAIRHGNTYTTTISGNTRRVAVTETTDTGSLISISSDQWTMPSGTYIVITPACNNTTNSTFYPNGFYLYNVSDSDTICKTSFNNFDAGTNYWAMPGIRTFTLAASKTLELRAETTTATFPSSPVTTTGLTNGQSEWLFIKIA